jgi:hypothetical protein
MRTLLFAALLLSAPCLAEDIELFTDRGETYVRAGEGSGLQRGVSIDVVTKAGKKIGTAMVMETWPALARVNLDEAARTEKSAVKYAVVVAPKPPAPSPPPPPPSSPAPTSDKRTPLGPPSAGPQPGGLKGRAVYGGAGPWTALQVINESDIDWTQCRITLVPMKSSYNLLVLHARDHELIGRSNFTNPDFSGDPTSAQVICREGSAMFPLD